MRPLLDASPASSLPLSFLVEILGERDEQLLDELRKLVDRKRRELGQRELGQRDRPEGERIMFAVRGIAVSFSIFVLLYCVLSLAVCAVWRSVWLGGQRYPARRCADLLFTLRMIPFAVATGVTLALAVPSFLLLEPRAVDEPMGVVPVVLSLCGIAVLLAGMWSAAAALRRASRTIARWSKESRRDRFRAQSIQGIRSR